MRQRIFVEKGAKGSELLNSMCVCMCVCNHQQISIHYSLISLQLSTETQKMGQITKNQRIDKHFYTFQGNIVIMGGRGNLEKLEIAM